MLLSCVQFNNCFLTIFHFYSGSQYLQYAIHGIWVTKKPAIVNAIYFVIRLALIANFVQQLLIKNDSGVPRDKIVAINRQSRHIACYYISYYVQAIEKEDNGLRARDPSQTGTVVQDNHENEDSSDAEVVVVVKAPTSPSSAAKKAAPKKPGRLPKLPTVSNKTKGTKSAIVPKKPALRNSNKGMKTAAVKRKPAAAPTNARGKRLKKEADTEDDKEEDESSDSEDGSEYDSRGEEDEGDDAQ